MSRLFTILVAGLLGACAVVAALVWDLDWNEGAFVGRLTGRTAMEQACLPLLTGKLTSLGFTPLDVTLQSATASRRSFALFGETRRLVSSFVFFDGDDGPRVDGTMTCETRGRTITVEVDTGVRPRRVT